mgnify:CR=1 FL=1|jgi:uncharacterized protein involved in exopolysaccharide biosynthesis
MSFLKSIQNTFSIVGELLGFVWKRRWWMIPLILVLLLVGALIALASAASVFPFIYTLF